ncbi:MAG: C4-dicarboxylate ABC transporter substrate-binding protein [Desulfuromonas sp.]|nr:MAG: C4-dicarboxylate ABC transporter substrate-binding protein [Desulfuromonas sp.]
MKQPLKLIMVLFFAVFILTTVPVSARTQYVTIGTGAVAGVYYPTGIAISKMVNAKSQQYNLRVSVESTGGSVFNVNAIMVGDLEFGIVQSDRQYQAYNGTAEWAGKPQPNLRSIFSIHPESVTLLAAVDAGINRLDDLRGKTVLIGNPGSGQQGNALDVLEMAGIDYRTDLKAEDLRATEAAKMLQAGQIDAYFYTVGHPNDSFREATSGKRKTRFVPIDQAVVDRLIDKYPYYVPSEIPVAFYPGVKNRDNVPGFGVKATFCTSASVDEEVVYAIVKEVFEHLAEFKKMHPAYSVLTRQSMLQGLSAPLHRGAVRYYKESGLID